MMLTDDQRINMFRDILRERRFEEAVKKRRLAVKGFLHLSIGEEAAVTGLASSLKPTDYIATNHRGHSQAIAKGVPLKELMAEIYGKQTGCSHGRGGSMHLFSKSHRVIGGNAILGANIVFSNGVALASVLRGTKDVVIACIGDGAMNQGTVHEGFNLAAVWKLPIVFACINNLYGISTHISTTTAIDDLAERAKAYGFPGGVVDGMDVEAVQAAASQAVEYARAGNGPTLLELKAYRFCGSFVGDPEHYRTKEEVQQWKKKDPEFYGDKLVEMGVLTEDGRTQIEAEVEQEINEAIQFAETSPVPSESDITKDVFAPFPGLPSGVQENPSPCERVIEIGAALNEAMHHAMDRDDSVFVLGEDIAQNGGEFQVTKGLLQKYGASRVRDTPISENAIIGAALGAATEGFRPVADIIFCDFLGVAMDQLINQASKLRYMFGGGVSVPMVVRAPYGTGLFAGPQHSQSLEALFTHLPGIKVVMPTTAYDAKGLLTTSIIDDNPVLFFEHKLLYKTKDFVPENEYSIPFGQAAIRRPGDDLTIVAWGRMVHEALAAAESLSTEGFNAEVIDLRTLVPLDLASILQSVKRTNKLMIVQEACKTGGFAAEISAQVNENAFDDLDSPIIRVAGLDIPIPFAPNLASISVPNRDLISQTIREHFSK